MDMKQIKFTYKYKKMPENPSPSKLLEVIPIDLADISKDFRHYDATAENGEKYLLPKEGEYILLLLLSKDNRLWTTLRGFTMMKYMYYRSMRGMDFEIVITGEQKCK